MKYPSKEKFEEIVNNYMHKVDLINAELTIVSNTMERITGKPVSLEAGTAEEYYRLALRERDTLIEVLNDLGAV